MLFLSCFVLYDKSKNPFIHSSDMRIISRTCNQLIQSVSYLIKLSLFTLSKGRDT